MALVVARDRLRPDAYSDTRGAQVEHYDLHSAILGRTLEEVAVVPPGGGRRPLLVFLHGRHDPGPLHRFGLERTGPESVLNDAFFAGLARLGRDAPVVVALNGGAHSYYHDRRDGRWASMLLREAIPDARRRFATDGHVAIGGISMGGYGAVHLAELAPHRFCAVGAHSAALWTSPGATAPGAFDDAEDYARNDVFRHPERLDTLPVWIDGGDADPFRDANAELRRRLHGRDVTFHVWPGGHTGTYWRAHWAQYLRWYADRC